MLLSDEAVHARFAAYAYIRQYRSCEPSPCMHSLTVADSKEDALMTASKDQRDYKDQRDSKDFHRLH